jgi:hypothetical protein
LRINALKERAYLWEGKVRWENYMSGKANRKRNMELLGTEKVCFVAPGRMETIATIIAKLQ